MFARHPNQAYFSDILLIFWQYAYQSPYQHGAMHNRYFPRPITVDCTNAAGLFTDIPVLKRQTPSGHSLKTPGLHAKDTAVNPTLSYFISSSTPLGTPILSR